MVLAALATTALVWLMNSPAEPPVLQSAQPAPGAKLGRAPDQVLLRFAESAVPGAHTTVVVLSPKDKNLARGQATPSAVGVSQRVAPARDRGAYQVSYEVVSPDGQVTRGSYWFSYTPTSGSVPTWLGFPALVLLAAVAALVIALLQRRRKTITPRAPAHVAATTSHPVPAQRSRDHHEGPSVRRPRPASEREPMPETPERSEPRQS